MDLDSIGQNGRVSSEEVENSSLLRSSSYHDHQAPIPNHVSTAYDFAKKRKDVLKSRLTSSLLIGADCLFIGMQPILVFMSKGPDGRFPFNPVSVNFLTEVAKIGFALLILLVQSRSSKGEKRLLLSPRSIAKAARANALLAVPAFLFAVNNYLKFAMQLFFKPVTVKMLSNLKVLVIALLLRCIMKRKFSGLQWQALCLLLIGISVNQISTSTPCSSFPPSPPPSSSSTSTSDDFSAAALICTFLTVTIPSTASVFNEYALKSQYETNVHLQNLFLFGYGAFFNLLFFVGMQSMGVASGGGEGSSTSLNLLHGHSRSTLLLVANNALQGMLSSFFFKFADTILKKYSSTIATIVTGVASSLLFAFPIGPNFVLGVSIVLISMHQFFSPEAKPKSSPIPSPRNIMNSSHPLSSPTNSDAFLHAPRSLPLPATQSLHRDESLLNIAVTAEELTTVTPRSLLPSLPPSTLLPR